MNTILKLSLLNMVRHKDRAAFTIIGLALALGILFFVYSVGVSYQDNVTGSFNYVTRDGINLWLTPPNGFHFDSETQLIFSNGTMPYQVYDQISNAIANGTLPKDSAAYAELLVKTSIDGKPFIVWGTTRISGSQPTPVFLNAPASTALGVSISQQFTLAGRPVVFAQQVVAIQTPMDLMIVPLDFAYKVLNAPARSVISWVSVRAPLFKTTAHWLSGHFDFVESTSPLAVITPTTRGIVFVLPAGFTRFQVVSFSSQLSALSLGKVVNTAYGLLANISLGLGFVLVVSTALLNMEERRRELGMWSAIGIAEDTFFIFLIESILVYAIASILGFVVGIVFSAAFTPWTLQLSTLGRTSLALVPYFPTLVIVGSLIPLQILLNKKPLDLLLRR
jgi:hypothetical protein